jgi:hypothetical protein
MLRELSISGKEMALDVLPGFDFHKLRQLRRVIWETSRQEESTATVYLTVSYEDRDVGKSAEVTLKCVGVRQCRLPDLGSRCYLSEIEIEDVSADQWEGIRFRIESHGMNQCELHAKAIEIIECKLEAGDRASCTAAS